jgi:hypothetical protein
MGGRMARALLAVLSADQDACEAELEFLQPFERIMPSQWCLATSRLLGLLAHVAGRRPRALEHFERALTFCRESGFGPDWRGAVTTTRSRCSKRALVATG